MFVEEIVLSEHPALQKILEHIHTKTISCEIAAYVYDQEADYVYGYFHLLNKKEKETLRILQKKYSLYDLTPWIYYCD